MQQKFNVGERVFLKGRVLAVRSQNPNTAVPDYYYQIDIGNGNIAYIHERNVLKDIKIKHGEIIDAKEYKEGHWK